MNNPIMTLKMLTLLTILSKLYFFLYSIDFLFFLWRNQVQIWKLIFLKTTIKKSIVSRIFACHQMLHVHKLSRAVLGDEQRSQRDKRLRNMSEGLLFGRRFESLSQRFVHLSTDGLIFYCDRLLHNRSVQQGCF